MALLIIGGLLAIALLAILGAVFLGMSEQRAEKARSNGSVAVSYPGSTTVMEQSSTAHRITERSAPPSQNLTTTSKSPLSPTGGDQQQYALNGQFHELSVELQTMYQHAWELERRLRTLAEVAERIEKTNSSEIGAGGEMHAQSSTEGTS